MSQSLREFFKPTRHAVFYFLLYFFFTSIGLYLHAYPKPKMTEKFQLPYFQKSNGILHVFLSSHVFIFFQNSKLSSFFVVKMKKKNNFKKKKIKVWILQNQMRTEKQMRAAALRHRFFFSSLISCKKEQSLWNYQQDAMLLQMLKAFHDNNNVIEIVCLWLETY